VSRFGLGAIYRENTLVATLVGPLQRELQQDASLRILSIDLDLPSLVWSLNHPIARPPLDQHPIEYGTWFLASQRGYLLMRQHRQAELADAVRKLGRADLVAAVEHPLLDERTLQPDRGRWVRVILVRTPGW
jgi:hypothetical protein